MRLCITGKNSYIGNAVEAHLKSSACTTAFEIEKISLKDAGWEEYSFQGTDCILHVAGIAHADVGLADEQEKRRYYEVNCELAVRVAKKAKAEGVKQFIYMSSIIVYGDSAPFFKGKHITAETKPMPANFYGDSKWQAEQDLVKLQDDTFRVAIVRSPMVYGKGCKGNYRLLEKLAGMTPVFPKVKNERSMIYIENLAEFLRLLMLSGAGGCYVPQNKEYVNTSRMVYLIRKSKGHGMWLSYVLSLPVAVMGYMPGPPGRIAKKAFGSITVDPVFGDGNIKDYRIYTLEESIRRINEG